MRIHIIACRILSRELNYLASKCTNQIDITWVGRGLHNTPEKLRAHLKHAVDDLYGQMERGELEHRPDYIVLGYGLCSNGVVGVTCRDIPIVVPRTDDCIALFLGSQQRYLQEFEAVKGAYWLNSNWIEQSGTLFDQEDVRRRKWQEYAEKFGEDNADYLMEMEDSWMRNYSTLGYIHSSVYNADENLLFAQQEAQRNNWNLHEVHDDLRLLRMMVEGTWNEAEFLILKPGQRIVPDYTGLKLAAADDTEQGSHE